MKRQPGSDGLGSTATRPSVLQAQAHHAQTGAIGSIPDRDDAAPDGYSLPTSAGHSVAQTDPLAFTPESRASVAVGGHG
jgi:hypothetical protein